MTIDVQWLVEPAGLDDEGVRRAARAALAFGGRPELELSVALVDDPTLAELHERCLGDPSVTDVMSFDLSDGGPGPGGEVVVSVDRARAVCAERGGPLDREIALYVVHGALHLCGFDDRDGDQRVRMRAAEAAVLASLDYPADDRPHDLQS